MTSQPTHIFTPGVSSRQRAIDSRVRRLETVNPPADAAMPRRVAEKWFRGGPVAVADGGIWTPEIAYSIIGASLTLVDSGTTTTTVTFERNGAFWFTISLTSGQSYVSIWVPTYVTAARVDRIQPKITAAGSGADSLTIQLERR